MVLQICSVQVHAPIGLTKSMIAMRKERRPMQKLLNTTLLENIDHSMCLGVAFVSGPMTKDGLYQQGIFQSSFVNLGLNPSLNSFSLSAILW